MRADSPRWEEINPSQFAHEKDGLRELAEYLPDADPYHVWANVEFVANDGSINEVDALVLTPSGLFVVELKHWQGQVSGDGAQWVRRAPNGRLIPSDNPYILTNRKAKRLAGLIRHYTGQRPPYVGAVVFLHAELMQSTLDEVGRTQVYGLDGHAVSNLPSFKQFLLDHPKNPAHLVDPARGRKIVEMVRAAKIRPSVRDRKVGQLLLLPKPFAEGNGWQDYIAAHTMDMSRFKRVRFYLTSRATDEEIPVIRRAAEREFRLLQGMYHPGIPRATDLVDHAWGPAVVFDHEREWERLDQWLARRGPGLTLAQRLTLVQDLAEIVDYAHSRHLAHRALNPQAIFVANPDQARPALVVTDWQTSGRLAGATQVTRLSSTDGSGLELFFDDEIRRYQAPEATSADRVPGTQLDVFSLGALTYRIVADRPPAATAEDLMTAVRDAGLNLAAVLDGVPDTLATLVYDATRGDPAQRIRSVAAFRSDLDRVWDELTAPEPEPVLDPLKAHKGDRLDGGLTVLRRLGTGATATALLVKHDDGRLLVLKVARDEQHADRLAAEARALAKLGHWQVAALVQGPVTIGQRTALLLESAGSRSLAEDLRDGRLALELLERYGTDLLDIVALLDGYGVWHRDIKPANLAARPRPKDKQPHLCIFDFSLTETPAEQLSAGTVPYLDPFLGPPRRLRYDAAAERFAAAVTLYEMATGTLPRWGENANPRAISDEVTLEPAAFDPAIADRLVAFFATALARDAGERFATGEEMRDAWRLLFVNIPEPDPAGPAEPRLDRDSPLEATGLTARARSALQRLGVHTVGELLDYEPSTLTRAKGVPDATRKEILARARSLRTMLAAPRPEPPVDRPLPHGIEAVCAALLSKRAGKERHALAVLLGQKPADDGTFLAWPAQSEAAAHGCGQSQPQLSIVLRRAARTWLGNEAVTQVRNEIVALLENRGSVMAAVELAEALISARGSYTPEPLRLPQAIGVVRAAVEAELSRGGDARLAIQRLRNSTTVLVGREPDDPAAVSTAAQRMDYAVRLGKRAAQLASTEPLLSRGRAIEALRTVPAPDDMPALSDQRLLQLAAVASGDQADLSTQGLLYPVGLTADRAMRLAVGSLVGQRLSADQVQARVRSRFPRAAALPRRPDLDNLLVAAGVPLLWDANTQTYLPRSQPSFTGTRSGTSLAPLGGAAEASEVDGRLADILHRNGFLAVLVSFRQLPAARRALLARLDLVEVDVTAILLRQLRALDFPWDTFIAADNGTPTDPDFRSLTELVAHQVVPAVRQAIDAAGGPVLITEAAPLARYDQMRLLQELADVSRPRPAGRLLLVPTRRPDPPMLDRTPLPLTSPASQSTRLPDSWITPTVQRTATP